MTSDRTPTTAVYLPDPDNDETLTMSGRDWWRYRAAIEAEATAAEHERAVDACAKLVIAAKAEAVDACAKIVMAAKAEAHASLDVERIAAFLHDEYGCRITCRGGRLADDRHPSHNEAYLDQAERLRAALEEPTP